MIEERLRWGRAFGRMHHAKARKTPRGPGEKRGAGGKTLVAGIAHAGGIADVSRTGGSGAGLGAHLPVVDGGFRSGGLVG
jgi:hypothetical protein